VHSRFKHWHIVLAAALAPSIVWASPVGLSIRIQDGTSGTVELIGNDWRFVEELDITAGSATATDQGIGPVITAGDLAELDWTGVQLVDQEWRPDGTGTFTRQRFYRGAAWMEQPSFFLVFQIDENGRYLPEVPFVFYAGSDDRWSGLDGGFIRRFAARQITTGCVAVDDCSTATGYMAQGLVQVREPQHAILGARRISQRTAKLRILWTADPTHVRDVPIDHVDEDEAMFGYGFEANIETATAPQNGMYYTPGEAITFELSFTDGDGNPLDDDGVFPTYADFMNGGTESGLRYLDIMLNPTLYYALKHREGNMLLAMGGPTDALRAIDYTVPLTDFFLPQIQTAFSTEHGFSAVATGIPPFGIIFGGLSDANLWNVPISNEVTLTVPNDALPGTYVVALKARREYAGEAINSGDVTRIQVGTTERTQWEPTTDGCQTCHAGPAAVGNILHGIGDRESCLAGCHVSLEIEPDTALDYRAHFVHTRSSRYPGDPDDCSTCHIEQPDGIPRGYPGFVYPF